MPTGKLQDNDPKAYVVYEYDLIDHESYIRCVYLNEEEADKQVDLMNRMRTNRDYEYIVTECPLIDKKQKRDMKNQLCNKCRMGRYVETSLQDDLDGKLHCDNCNHETVRHIQM